MDAERIIFVLKLRKAIDELKTSGNSTTEQIDEIEKLFYSLSFPLLKTASGISQIYQSQVNSPIKNFGGHIELIFTLSIDYSFISDDRKKLREQLESDNLNMEFTFINHNISKSERFFKFVFYAFMQIEELINYYYFIKYPQVEDLLSSIKKYNPKFNIESKINDVSDIPMSYKIYSFSSQFFPFKPGDFTFSNINNMRLLRNYDVHRFNAIIESNNNEKLKDFIKHSNYKSIRETLLNVVEKVQSEC